MTVNVILSGLSMRKVDSTVVSVEKDLTNYICHKCGKTTDCVRANDHLCMDCVMEWYSEKE
jgi:hypothetical protein